MNKTITKEFGAFKNVLLTSVAMPTMTFQYGGYFENKFSNPHFFIL
jgi:hypothetical protein